MRNIFKKDSLTFFESFQDKVWANLEYLGTKMTEFLITDALRYLSEAAES